MNQRVDDFIAHEPDWQEWLENSDHSCWNCDGLLIFDSYDPVYREVLVHCKDCREPDKIGTGPDPDTAYDRED